MVCAFPQILKIFFTIIITLYHLNPDNNSDNILQILVKSFHDLKSIQAKQKMADIYLNKKRDKKLYINSYM